MNTQSIIRHCERLLTLTKRAIVSDDRDARRDEVIAEFGEMATGLGKIASRLQPTNWGGAFMAVHDLHTEAVGADERRSGTFAHAASEMALVSALHSLAAVLGFTLADADVAAEDEAAQAAVEGEYRDAAE